MDLPFRLHALQREDAAYIENKHLEFFIELGHERERLNPEFDQLIVPIGDGVINFHKDSQTWSRTYGLGLKQSMSDADLDRLEAIYSERGIRPQIEVCSLADPGLLQKLGHRGYGITDWTSVLMRRFDADELFPPPAKDISIEFVDMQDEPAFTLWRNVLAEGFSTWDDDDLSDPDDSLVYLGSKSVRLYMARFNGEPAGAAAVAILDEIALLIGASTLPQFRKKGIQSALINHRFPAASKEGCKVATIYTTQSSASQANAQRLGFYIIYNQVNFRLDTDKT